LFKLGQQCWCHAPKLREHEHPVGHSIGQLRSKASRKCFSCGPNERRLWDVPSLILAKDI
jgi:hypothetical protein